MTGTLRLALHDALNNQRAHGAIITVTLKGSAQISGELKPPPDGKTFHDMDTAYILTVSDGWATFVLDELAAVGVENRQYPRL